MSRHRFVRLPCCTVVVTVLVVLILIVGCGKVEPTAALVPPADTLVPPTAVPEPTSTPIPTPSGGGGVITFVSNRDGSTALYVMAVPDGAEADGTDQRRLTHNDADDRYPAWSPDGTQIAFTSKCDGNDEIYVMNADGSAQRRLTNTDANN